MPENWDDYRIFLDFDTNPTFSRFGLRLNR